MARLWWVTAEVPDHAGGGGQLRQAHLIDRVAPHVETHLVVREPLTDAAVRGAVASVTEVPHRPPAVLETWTARKWRLWRHQLTERHPWEVARSAPQRRLLRAALVDRVAESDVVLVEHLELAPLLADVGRARRRVLTLHYDAARQARQRAGVAPTRRNRAFWRAQARRAQRLHAWAVAHADVLVTVSEADAAGLRRSGGARVEVVPNGVDLQAFAPSPLPPDPEVVVTATLDYAPNVDGLVWFVDEVWPAVRASVPAATLRVVGRRPLPRVRALAGRDGITLHADVPAVQPFLAAARVALVPLRLGGGTRLKALQALAAGRVLVGTTTGVEGLGVADGTHGLVVDDPAELARAVVRGLTDDELAARLARAGRAHVEAHYGWDRIGRRLVDVLLG